MKMKEGKVISRDEAKISQEIKNFETLIPLVNAVMDSIKELGIVINNDVKNRVKKGYYGELSPIVANILRERIKSASGLVFKNVSMDAFEEAISAELEPLNNAVKKLMREYNRSAYLNTDITKLAIDEDGHAYLPEEVKNGIVDKYTITVTNANQEKALDLASHIVKKVNELNQLLRPYNNIRCISNGKNYLGATSLLVVNLSNPTTPIEVDARGLLALV